MLLVALNPQPRAATLGVVEGVGGAAARRLEWVLSPGDPSAALLSRTVLLNGKGPLRAFGHGHKVVLPPLELEPRVESGPRVRLPPFGIGFFVWPDAAHSACVAGGGARGSGVLHYSSATRRDHKTIQF